jgi:hypothetical protein
MTHVDN